jgi:nitrite reductase/ring-hydroxylating ferredoxin subunit
MSAHAPPQHWHELPHAPAPGTALCSVHGLPDGQVTLLDLETGGGPTKPFRLLLLRSGTQVTAFVNRCAHFGVPLAARQEQLIFKPHASITCNVHYARYRWADGVCEWGECEGESLLPVPLERGSDGMLRVGLPTPTHASPT